MFDVLPPRSGQGRFDSERPPRAAQRRRREEVASDYPEQHIPPPAGPRVVKMQWKLPARLRRPIRDELRRQRRIKRKQQEIARFVRRPLLTSHVRKSSAPARSQPENSGAEHHTGDVYMKSQPIIRVAPPPYAGRIAPGAFTARPEARVTQPQKAQRPLPSERSERQQTRMSQAPRWPAAPARKPRLRQNRPRLPASERDIPFSWDQYQQKARTNTRVPVADEHPVRERVRIEQDVFGSSSEANVELIEVRQPRRRMRLPFRVTLWPFSTREVHSGRVNQAPVSQGRNAVLGKKKVLNLVILLIGCGLVYGLVWNLQGAGRGLAVAGAVESQARQAYGHLLEAQQALAQQDFAKSSQAFISAQEQLGSARQELNNALAASRVVLQYVDVTGTVRSGDQLLAAGEHLTVAGQHVSRGLEILLGAKIQPADGTPATIVEAIQESQQEFSAGQQALTAAEQALSRVDSPFVPAEVQAQVDQLRRSVPRINEFVTAYLDQSELLLHVLGAQRQRQYLLLFANNHEIRPTGGFIGSIGLVHVDRGVVENVDVQTVYDPDGQLKEFIAPPDPLLPITNRWYLRDANWFVNYSLSAQKIADFFEKEGGPTVDGVISLTPEVIRRLLEVTGPIPMEDYDVIVSSENFIEVTQAQVTYEYDKEQNRPKQFMADLTPILLNRIFTQPSDGRMHLLETLTQAMEDKHVLLYFPDDDVQAYVLQQGWAGDVPRDVPGFLMVNNANIGGHKSDQFIEQEIDYRSDVKANGDVDVVVTIRRTHRGPQEASDYPYPEGEDPTRKDNIVYQRVLVPTGAQLIEATGFASSADIPRYGQEESELELTVDTDVAEWQRGQITHPSGTAVGQEAGYTFFANWLITEPGQTSVALYHYVLPNHADVPGLVDSAGQYSVYVAKQPGDDRTSVRASILPPAKVNVAYIVPAEGITRHEDGSIVYRSELAQDRLFGAVFEKN